MEVKGNKDIFTFLNFSSIYRWQTTPLEDGATEIRLMDLRYLNNGRYSFVAIAHLTQDNKSTTPTSAGSSARQTTTQTILTITYKKPRHLPPTNDKGCLGYLNLSKQMSKYFQTVNKYMINLSSIR